ncbi:hypothetical protein [Lysobacter silvisoli]|uniref:Uncharacterized protein n=1 Tax=Lysobacter silvisoli TaxID=2293254 RepID=A0A371JWI1_9GAMM|nr:hypothetical protein [Lysobacter silvisoli]RDZ26012.1 hypothetical protein DX914_19315 [Lysobacter silvisoli]
MSQNLLSLTLPDDQLAAIDATLTQLEAQLVGLVSLTIDDRRALAKMGPKSEQFCRQTLIALAQHPQVVPPGLSVAEAQADLAALDRLRPRLLRLQRLVERAQDTDMALGSDVMSAALEGYALLRVSGKHHGLETLRQSLSARFDKTARRAEVPPLPGPLAS